MLFSILIVGLLWWAEQQTRPWLYTESLYLYYVVLGLAWFCSVMLALNIIRTLCRLLWRWWVLRPGSRGGSAGFASGWHIWRAGLYRKKGVLLGLFKNRFPVFCDIESSGMVLSPAGGGKTTSFVIPALCHVPLSMLVTDLKCTLAPMTAALRKKNFKQEIVCLNPAGYHKEILGETAKYNPLIILIDDWQRPELQRFLVTDAQAIAKQLCEDPPQLGENQYFRNGSRKFLVFAMIYLVLSKQQPTLGDVLSLLCDHEAMQAALQVAKVSPELDGDLARLAKDLLTKFEEGDARQTESFREGAVQSLEVFAPSGSLAECTSACTFRFAELKKKPLSVYLMADPTRQSVYAPWLGLLSWCALTELVRSPSSRRVMFLLDEVCNFKIQGLPALLTLVREFKICMWLMVQELQQWGVMYGRDTIATLLSQTEAKVFLQNRSFETCKLISDMLGEETIKTQSHGLGTSIFNPVSHSMQDAPRRLMTPDEVRRTEDVIVFVKGYRPLRLHRIGYHEVSPWKHQVGINPLYGKTFKGRTRLRL